MTIIGLLHIINSKRDRNGNCYFAFIFTSTKNGKVVCGQCGGSCSGNINMIRFYWNGRNRWENDIAVTTAELPIREFNRLTKCWPMVGCEPRHMVKHIEKGVK